MVYNECILVVYHHHFGSLPFPSDVCYSLSGGASALSEACEEFPAASSLRVKSKAKRQGQLGASLC